MADIYVSKIDRSEVWQFPTIPEEFPTISQPSKSEEFSTFNNGDFNLQNGVGLKSFSMGFMLPLHKYNFNKCDFNNTQNIINLILTSMVEKFPIRFIFKGEGDSEYTNIMVTVETFEYNFNKQLDIVFSGEFKEFRVTK